MKKNILAILIGLAALCLAPAARAALSVQVDRDQLSLDETLNLTITKDSSGSIDTALLKPLTNDFQILSRSQSSSTQIINGSMSSSSTLTLALAPKRAGLLTIPALTIGKETSRPQSVKVLSQAPPATRADKALIFMETEVDAHSVWVQAQLIYTQRIYWAVTANITEPEPPQLTDALVEKLDDAKFTKLINGRSFQVFERKYAIFPQKSGVLEIPPVMVQARVAGRGRADMFADFFGAQEELVRLHGHSEKITVREKPQVFPAGAVWLPTAKLSLSENWSRDLKGLRVGEPLSLTISLTGEGLLAAQLPKIALPDLDGVKLYPDKGEVKNLAASSGITGLRKENIALVAIRPGSIELPEIRIPWWDKVRGKVAYAVIPARRLEIGAAEPGSGGTDLQPPSSPPPALSSRQPQTPVSSPPLPQPAAGSRLPVVLGGLSLILALAWLATLLLLLKTKRQLATQTTQKRESETAQGQRLRKHFKALARNCRNDDPVGARAALLAWAEANAGGKKVRTPGDLAKLFPGSGLAEELAGLDRCLYGQGADPAAWRGAGLLAAAAKAVTGRDGSGGKGSALPPLYQ